LIVVPLAPHEGVIPQAGALPVEVLVVVGRGWMAVQQAPVGGMETMDVLTHRGVDPAMETFVDADPPGPLDSAGDHGMHPEPLAVVIAVRVTAVRVIVDLTNVVLTSAVLKRGVSTIAALATSVSRVVVRRTVALKIAVLALDQAFVPVPVVSAMATPAARVRDVLTAMTVRLRSNPAERRRPMEPTPLQMICSGAGMPPRRPLKLVVRSIASGAPVRCGVLPNSCLC
jgi:hypothetical protein